MSCVLDAEPDVDDIKPATCSLDDLARMWVKKRIRSHFVRYKRYVITPT